MIGLNQRLYLLVLINYFLLKLRDDLLKLNYFALRANLNRSSLSSD